MRDPVASRLPNRKAKEVFQRIRLKGTISKQELQEATGYTISTLTRLLEELVELGFIEETGFGESTGGRRPTLYRIRADYGYVLGLDISRATSRIVLCDMNLNKLDSIIWPMTSRSTPEHLIDAAAAAAKAMLAKHHIQHGDVLGIGIGAVGPLDRQAGMIFDPQGFPSEGWMNIPICRILSERLALPAYLDNGANTALLGEYWSDEEHRSDHMLYVHVGVGIRSAVMVGGKIAHGAFDMEGAVGQMIIQSDGVPPINNKGNYGAWESYVTTHALVRTAVSQIKRGRASRMRGMVEDVEQLTYAHLEQAYAEGDPLAREIYLNAAASFGIGLANLLNILHPEIVILGGPIAGHIDCFYDDGIRIAILNTYYYPEYQVKFLRSRLQDDAVAIGAASMVIQQLSI